jgi:hypothetical protein
MACLFNALGAAAGDEVSLDAQRPRDDKRILLGRRIECTQIPEGVRAVLREGLPVEDHVLGLNRFSTHPLLPCGHYDRCGDERQVVGNLPLGGLN